MDSPAKSPANASSSDDNLSVFGFRFWRSLVLIVHSVFLHHLFQVLDLGRVGSLGCVCFLGAVLAILISAATLQVYRRTARALCLMNDRPILSAFQTASIVLLHELIVQQLKGNPQALVLLPLQTLCFICYLRSVTRGDPSSTMWALFYISIRNAVFFHMDDESSEISSVSFYFFAAGMLECLAKNSDRGFRAPNAGSFDRFLDFLD